MKIALLSKVAVSLILLASLCHPVRALELLLDAQNTGYSWYQRQNWMGGTDTQTGFSYGDPGSGLLHVQNNYQYYGGADRWWERKNVYIQINLAGLNVATLETASLKLYVTENDSPSPTGFMHLDTQTETPTGDASQQLAGDTTVISSDLLAIGWNQINITDFIVADLNKGYDYAVFYIPQFSQAQDENRILSFYGASSTVEIGGSSARPILDIQIIPEANALLLLGAGALVLLLPRRHSYRRQF